MVLTSASVLHQTQACLLRFIFRAYYYLMLHSHKHLSSISSNRSKNPRHYIVLIASVIYPLTTIPQIIEIFNNKSSTNISVSTYALYLFFTIIFLVYGIKEKLVPIIVLQSLWLVMYGVVTIGIILYH